MQTPQGQTTGTRENIRYRPQKKNKQFDVLTDELVKIKNDFVVISLAQLTATGQPINSRNELRMNQTNIIGFQQKTEYSIDLDSNHKFKREKRPLRTFKVLSPTTKLPKKHRGF